MLRVDFSENPELTKKDEEEVKPVLLKPGSYPARIKGVKETVKEDEDKFYYRVRKYLTWEFSVDPGEYTMFYITPVVGMGLHRLQQVVAAATGIHVLGTIEFNPECLVGRIVNVRVRTERYGDKSVSIIDFVY